MRIGIIGAGNVAWNLVAGLQNSPYEVVQVLSRTLNKARGLAEEFGIAASGTDPTTLQQDLDLVLIATSDHSVPLVAQVYAEYRGSNTIFAHTSGSMPLEALAPLGDSIGVFYPMQSFTRGRLTKWRPVPLFLEGSSAVMVTLDPVARHLSDEVSRMDSAGRLRIHLGAVYINNFTNYLYQQVEEIIQQDLKVYAPLIRETLHKALDLGAKAAMTGPARRGDQVTMDKHMQLLSASQAELYRTLSSRIGQAFRVENK